ncbi:leucyl aminopeptidase [Microbacterium sp. APC 3901]|uniref:leucyl aminopeptidase n=1 Tax=Microbacterium sp. APC 3901 TaxID=3035192 RepID=UPI0025B4DE37|nr:leucyl aminopeptidase [Microbacterium sp. APC 3901]MDN3445503.1 leucyl aminopeptidase [Microbacterium sp. APC 3901]
MTRSPNKLIPVDFPTLPGLDALEGVTLGTDGDVDVIGYGVHSDAEVPDGVALSREALVRAGFDSQVGETLTVPQPDGPDVIVVGLGETERLTPAVLRDASAAFARASSRRGSLRLILPPGRLPLDADGLQAAYEGMLLARYRYTPLKAKPKDAPLTAVSVVIGDTPAEHTESAVARAAVAVRAAVIARDLANTPPGHLTATDMGDIAVRLGERFGFEVQLFDKAALIELGCGGLLGVNQGSVEEPRMIRLHYVPAGARTGHLGLIGKGIMYDSGGISLKPSDPMHLLMKMDMGGAAVVLGAFTGFQETGVTAEVTGWLMCTDNMPSGTSYKLGDVLTARGGTTIEVKNTDAEGRLVMSDAFVLADEAGVDAIVDIATLTGAALMALGTATAPVFANDDDLVEAVLAASASTGEPLWRMPLEQKYRSQLDSDIADIANLGGPYAGATTAALFLEHFVDDTPWAHIDIAGTMQSDGDDAWRSKGATGFGARLLLDTAAGFRSGS